MAKTSPSLFATQTGTPSSSTEIAVSSARSATAQARMESGTSDPPTARKFVFHGRHEPLLDLGEADALDEVGEEPAYDEASRCALVDAARHQVEQLLVVEAAGGRSVTGSGDLTGLDLEVGHAVGTRAVGEQEVAVELIGVGALGVRPDDDVADPDRVGMLALQRAFVGDPALAPRLVVVDQQPVLEVLTVVSEEQSEKLRVAAGTGEPHD